MHRNHIWKRYLIAAGALAVAALACSAPSGQQSGAAPNQEVAQAFTSTPFVVTATPEAVVVVTATPGPSGGSTGGTTGGSGGGTTGGSSGGSSSAPCDYDSQYQADLTIPDGAELTTGTAFTKTWRIKNNGCQVWPNGTQLIFLSGDQMGGPAGVPVPETAAGGTQDISVNLAAPGSAGDYTGKWQLRTPDGIQFGDKLTVKIKAVAPPPPAPGVTPTFHFNPGIIKLLSTSTPTPGIKVLVPIGPLLIANFTASYAGTTGGCIGFGTAYWVKVKNTGSLDFQSAQATFEAPVGTSVSDASNDSPFVGSKACGSSNTSVAAGDSAYLIGGATGFSSIPSGTDAKITIKLCTADGGGGTCATKIVTFTTS